MKKLLHNIRSSFKTKAFRTMPINFSSIGKVWMIGLLFSILFLYSNGLKSQNCSVNAGVYEEICESEQLFLHGNSSGAFPSGGEVTVWTQVGGPTATIVNPNSFNTEVTNLIGGNTYVFRISSTCEDGSLVFQDVTKTVLKITKANAGPDAAYCPNSNNANIYNLAANAAGANETGLWTGGGSGITVNNTALNNSPITISDAAAGTASFVWTINNSNGCVSTDTVRITNVGGELPVDAGDDITVSHCYSTTTGTSMSASIGGNNVNPTWL